MAGSEVSDNRLASGRLLARNSLLNLGSGGILLVLNVLFVPAMLASFGMELYGVLAVTWMVLGHLKWLDLGFSAACAKYVAQDLAQGRGDQAGKWAWTALTVQVSIGIFAAIGLWLLAPTLADLLKIGEETRPLVVLALRTFALVVPVDLGARSVTAVLEATQRFDWINGLTIMGAIWTYTTYAVGILRGGDFQAVVYGLVALRVANLIAAFWIAGRVLPSLRKFSVTRLGDVIEAARVREMFRFGGWVSVSAGIGPLIFFFDRWVISTIRGVAVLPLYTVPLQMLMALSIIPASISSTLFPAFSVLEASTRWDRVQALFVRAHRYLLLGLVPLFLLLMLWAPEILRIWIDESFAAEATLPFRILIVGFSVGLFAPFSGVLLQGAGRPDILSKLYLIELPINIALTLFLVRTYGVVGAAITYTLRTVVETIILWICVHRVFPLSWSDLSRGMLQRLAPVAIGSVLLVFFFPEPHIDGLVSLGTTIGALLVYGLVTYFYLLDDDDLAFLGRVLRRSSEKFTSEEPAGAV